MALVTPQRRSKDVSRLANATNLLNGAINHSSIPLAIGIFECRSGKRQIILQQRQSTPRQPNSPHETRRRPPRPQEAQHPRRTRVDDLQPHRLRPQRPCNPRLTTIIGSSSPQPTFKSEVDASDFVDGAATSLFPFFAPSKISPERRQLGGRGLQIPTPLKHLYTTVIVTIGFRHSFFTPTVHLARILIGSGHFRPLTRPGDPLETFPTPQNPHPKTIKSWVFKSEVVQIGAARSRQLLHLQCTHAAREPRRPGWRCERLQSTAAPAKEARMHHQVHLQVT